MFTVILFFWPLGIVALTLFLWKFHPTFQVIYNNKFRSTTVVPSTSSRPQQRRLVSETAHIWHQHEWIVGVLVMILLICLRIVHYTKGSWLYGVDNFEENVFDLDWTSNQVTRKLYNDYCRIDLEVLCANQGESYRMDKVCEALYGPFLTRRIFGQDNHLPLIAPDGHLPMCSLERQVSSRFSYPYQFRSVHDLEPYIQNKTLLQDKDAALLSMVIDLVISPYAPNYRYTCSHQNDYIVREWDTSTLDSTEDDLKALYSFYLKELLDLFATDKALNRKLIGRKWTTAEFLDMVSAVSNRLVFRRRMFSVVHRVIAQILEEQGVEDKVTSSRRQRQLISSVSKEKAYQVPPQRNEKHEFTLFPCNDVVDQCMYSHFDNHTLVTDVCAGRMKQAYSRMKELEYFPVSKEFVVYNHFSFLIVNLSGLLMLMRACSIRNKFKQRLDRERRQLEQELNDPFLRQALERKAQQLSEEERVRLFAGLERRIQNWDSSAGATEHTKRWLRRFRYMILFVLLLNVCFGLLLIIMHIESKAQSLENLFVGVLLYTLSYTVRIHEAKTTLSGDDTVDSTRSMVLQMTRIGETNPAEDARNLLGNPEENPEMGNI